MNNPEEQSSIKESLVKEALEKLDWLILKKHLDSISLTPDDFDSLLGFLRRANTIIMQYPNSQRETLRKTFLNDLCAYIKEASDEDTLIQFTSQIEKLLTIEKVYRSILDTLRSHESANLTPEVRIAACMHRVANQYLIISNEFQKFLNDRQELSNFRHLPGQDNQQPYSPDSVISALIDALSITLIMEAIKNKWLDKDLRVVIPYLPLTTENDQKIVAGVESLALLWGKWRSIEEGSRFLLRTFEVTQHPDLPSNVPMEFETFINSGPTNDNDVLDYIANERLQERLTQTFLEMLTETSLKDKVGNIEDGIQMMPNGFVCAEEAHAALMLSDILGYAINDSLETPGGLKLAEWLRGYMVLRTLAESRSQKQPPGTIPIFQVSLDEITSSLTKCGLKKEIALLFIDHVSLQAKNRQDLFNCPLLKLTDGSYILFAPSLLTGNPARILLSMISNLGEPLSKKGPAFEAYIRGFFTDLGYNAKSFKVNRDNEEYEYDVVLAWDDHLFIFECKNHGLSNHSAIQAYYGELEISSNVKQVNRLVQALIKYPDILKENMGIDIKGKQIIPCVLNSVPYSRAGVLENIYITDSSSLRRFFQGRYFYLNTIHPLGNKNRLKHRIALHSFWSSETPSPIDLVAELNDPFQLKLNVAHIKMHNTTFSIGKTFISIDDFTLMDKNIDSICKSLGIPPEGVHAEIDKVTKQIKKLNSVKKGKDES